MQKISSIICLILFVFNTNAFEGLSPEHVEAVGQIGCFVDGSVSSDGCEGEETCSGSTDELNYFDNFPYANCVREICRNTDATSLGSVLEARDESAAVMRSSLETRFSGAMTNLFNTLKGNATKGQEFLRNNPDFARKLALRKTVEQSQLDFSYALMQMGDPTERLPREGRVLEEIRNVYPHWNEALVRSNYRLVSLLREKMRTSEIILGVRREITNPNARTMLLGRFETLIRDLPPESTSKMDLLTTIYSLQSVNQISENVPNSFLVKLEEVALTFQLENIMHYDPEAIALQSQIYQNAGENRIEPEIYPDNFDESSKNLFISSCLYAMSEQAATLPTTQERARIVSQINSTRDQIITNMGRRLSRQTGTRLSPRLQNLEVSIPPSREDYLNRMEGLISEKRGVLDYYGQGEAASSSVHYSNLNVLNLGEGFCQLPLEIDANANALTTHTGHAHNHDRVSMGAMTLKDYPNIGEHIFAHEVGHIVSNFLQEEGSQKSKRSYQKTKNCLNRNQTGGGLGHLFSVIAGDPLANGVKEEEDYADLFAFMALSQDRNRNCYSFYEGQAFYSGVNSVRSTQATPHSPDLYRLLHNEAVAGRALPEVCLQEMRANNQEITIRNCWGDSRD